MWQGTVVGTVVRASMLINCDLGPSLCCSRSNGDDADQHIMLLGHRRYLASTLRACVTIRVSGNLILGATLHVVFLLYPSFVLVPWRVITATLLRGCAKVGTFR
jgi:hypothetical protein